MKINFNKYKESFFKKMGSFDDWSIPDAYGGVGYPPNSIFFSEALVLYSLAHEYNIDCFIESGVFRGGSTSLWCRTLSPIQLYSVDYVREGLTPEKKWNAVTTTLSSQYSNITFIRGDGNIQLPNVITSNPNKRFGVFVDGPKDGIGLKLMEKCFQYDNVFFSSLHDYSHKTYFSTKTNVEFIEIANGMNDSHPQINKYPHGPGLTVIDKNNLLT
jgi:hypothetical protein